jgi:hypothetical protein
MMVTGKVMRPTRSPMRPKMIAPNGRTRKPAWSQGQQRSRVVAEEEERGEERRKDRVGRNRTIPAGTRDARITSLLARH